MEIFHLDLVVLLLVKARVLSFIWVHLVSQQEVLVNVPQIPEMTLQSQYLVRPAASSPSGSAPFLSCCCVLHTHRIRTIIAATAFRIGLHLIVYNTRACRFSRCCWESMRKQSHQQSESGWFSSCFPLRGAPVLFGFFSLHY